MGPGPLSRGPRSFGHTVNVVTLSRSRVCFCQVGSTRSCAAKTNHLEVRTANNPPSGYMSHTLDRWAAQSIRPDTSSPDRPTESPASGPLPDSVGRSSHSLRNQATGKRQCGRPVSGGGRSSRDILALSRYLRVHQSGGPCSAPKVDRCVPQTQHVNLRKVDEPE